MCQTTTGIRHVISVEDHAWRVDAWEPPSEFDISSFQLTKVPGKCLPVRFSIGGNRIAWICLSIEHRDRRKKSSDAFANSDWPSKCSQEMSDSARNPQQK